MTKTVVINYINGENISVCMEDVVEPTKDTLIDIITGATVIYRQHVNYFRVCQNLPLAQQAQRYNTTVADNWVVGKAIKMLKDVYGVEV